MRLLTLLALILLSATLAWADQLKFSDVVKASIHFQDDYEANRHYPHILKVFLRLENIHNSDVCWVANSVSGIESELFDDKGTIVPPSSAAASIMSNSWAYLLPYGSRLDWLISHGGISFLDEAKDKIAIMVGCRGWLVPLSTVSTYSLRIKLRGIPWRRSESESEGTILLDIPATKIDIQK